MKRKHELSPQEDGFTLVELSIVLVIIGLIVGGVLVGQDMIRAAEIRSTIAQVESYNAAVNTFRDKYRNIPGDILAADAARFGMLPVRAGTNGRGDGDKLVETGVQTAALENLTLLGFETALFWTDLTFASLIDSGLSGGTDALAPTATLLDTLLPQADIGQGHYITVFTNAGRNFYSLTRLNQQTANGAIQAERVMTPQTAFNIDDKMDDGNPLNGTVRAVTASAAPSTPAALSAANNLATVPTLAAAAVGLCAVNPAPGVYNTSTETLANTPSCQLSIRASF